MRREDEPKTVGNYSFTFKYVSRIQSSAGGHLIVCDNSCSCEESKLKAFWFRIKKLTFWPYQIEIDHVHTFVIDAPVHCEKCTAPL